MKSVWKRIRPVSGWCRSVIARCALSCAGGSFWDFQTRFRGPHRGREDGMSPKSYLVKELAFERRIQARLGQI